jgi:tetratricopeptide (TPR) repeat protein
MTCYGKILCYLCSFYVVNIFAFRGDDKPQIVGRHFLEGITQPFKTASKETNQVPEWVAMKALADKMASERSYRSALREYGQLIRHPSYFGQMPSEEKYDTFISMSRLLKDMGFYQKAELLLYEAMSYNQEPYEAHYLLGLLFLDKEDIEKSKMHLKNCLFYKESDTVILIYLSTILFTEGKGHEAKFYVSRILKNLETKMSKLSSLLSGGSVRVHKQEEVGVAAPPEAMNHMDFIMGLEDLIVKVFHAEFVYIPSATVELFRFYFSFYQYLSRDDLKGRFVFDIGSVLYEHGK